METLDNISASYFSTINPLAKKIVRDTRAAKSILSDDWEGLNGKDQESALDDFFVDSTVREKYRAQTKTNSYPVSFPKLHIQCGEKIIVDMESDFWTWQDYHSAPFSWKTKSQQDLTLDDLELDQPKSQSKNAKKTASASNTEVPMAPHEFAYKTEKSIWQTDKYKDWESQYRNIGYEDVSHYDGLVRKEQPGRTATQKQPDELQTQVINQAYCNTSMEDLSCNNENKSISSSKEASKADSQPIPAPRTSRNPPSKSPLPSSRLKLSSSFSRKRGEEQEDLVKGQKKDYPKAHRDIENSVFDNPTMNIHEKYLTDDESVSSTTSSPSRKPLLQEPNNQMMDRSAPREVECVFVSDSLSGQTDTEDTELLEITSYHDAVVDADKNSDSGTIKTGFGFLDNW